MCRVRHCRIFVSRLRLVIVRREYLREGVADLDTSVEADAFVDGSIESHEEAWVLVVVLGNW